MVVVEIAHGIGECGRARYDGDGGDGDDVQVVDNGVEFSLTSPDGDGGFPGTVIATVRYTMTEPDVMVIVHAARLSSLYRISTVVNLTNHAYYNLSGVSGVENTIRNHTLKVNSNRYLELDANSCPTGNVLECSMDDLLKTMMPWHVQGPVGIDNFFVFKSDGCNLVLEHSKSGRVLMMTTTNPGK